MDTGLFLPVIIVNNAVMNLGLMFEVQFESYDIVKTNINIFILWFYVEEVFAMH